MTLPKYILEAAKESEASTGISAVTFLEFYQTVEKHKRKDTKAKVEEIRDEYTFDRWWDLYGKKKDQNKCMEKWSRMSYDERKAATERTHQYVLSTPDIRYRKLPLTWLNGKCWLDELPYTIVEANADKFMEYFNNLFEGTDIPALTEMNEYRRYLLNMAYTFHHDDILTVLDKVRDSSRLSQVDERGWRCTFEFIFTEDNFIKILEGYYDD